MKEDKEALEPGEDILGDILPEQERAGAGKRFLNHLVDYISFALLASAFMLLVYYVDRRSYVEWFEKEQNPILERLIYGLAYSIYMGIMEASLKGRSLGKFVTGTRAVNLDGSTITTHTAFARALCRIVPFNELSALFSGSIPRPWHDKWTKTMVVIERP